MEEEEKAEEAMLGLGGERTVSAVAAFLPSCQASACGFLVLRGCPRKGRSGNSSDGEEACRCVMRGGLWAELGQVQGGAGKGVRGVWDSQPRAKGPCKSVRKPGHRVWAARM